MPDNVHRHHAHPYSATSAAQATAAPATSVTPWEDGRLGRFGRARVLFGAMYEDATIECEAFRGCYRVFAIASSGDTARTLAAAGHHVDAVDINPVQLAYAVARSNGGGYRPGSAERAMSAGRLALRVGGWSTSRLAEFAHCNSIARQLDMWRELTSGRGGLAFRSLLAPAGFAPLVRKEFAALLNGNFARTLRARIDDALHRLPNAENPFAHMLFEGAAPPAAPAGPRPNLFCADAVAFLRNSARGSYDAATISNICDGTNGAFRRDLVTALQHAVKPGGPVVFRTFDTNATTPTHNLAARDRSMIWPLVTAVPVEALS